MNQQLSLEKHSHNVSEWSVDEDSEFSTMSSDYDLKRYRNKRKKREPETGSLSSIKYFLKEAENALAKRFEKMEDRKQKQLNAIAKTERGLQELKRTQQEFSSLHNSFDSLKQMKIPNNKKYKRPPARASWRRNEIDQDEEDTLSNTVVTRQSPKRSDMDMLKADLDGTDEALRNLKSGIDFSSRLPTEKLRREYLGNFLRTYEKEQQLNSARQNEYNHQVQILANRQRHMEYDVESQTTEATEAESESQYIPQTPDSAYTPVEENTVEPAPQSNVTEGEVFAELSNLIRRFGDNLEFIHIVLKELGFVRTNRARVEVLDMFAMLRNRGARQDENDEVESTSSQQVEVATTYENGTITPAVESASYAGSSSGTSQATSVTNTATPETPVAPPEEQDQDIMQNVTERLYRLVDSIFGIHTNAVFDEANLSRLCLDIFNLVGKAIPSATSELLSSIHKLLKLYVGTRVDLYRDDLIKDTLDILQDELVFNRVVDTIDRSYREDIHDLNSKLNQLQKKRAEDIENLRQNRILSLKADTYPVVPHHYHPSPKQATQPPLPQIQLVEPSSEAPTPNTPDTDQYTEASSVTQQSGDESDDGDDMESVTRWIRKKVDEQKQLILSRQEESLDEIQLDDLDKRAENIANEPSSALTTESYGERLKKDAQELYEQMQEELDQERLEVALQTDDEIAEFESHQPAIVHRDDEHIQRRYLDIVDSPNTRQIRIQQYQQTPEDENEGEDRKFRFDAETIEKQIQDEEKQYNDMFLAQLPTKPVERLSDVDPVAFSKDFSSSQAFENENSNVRSECENSLNMLLSQYKK